MTKTRWAYMICGIAIWLISGGPSIRSGNSVFGEHEFVREGVQFKVFFWATHSEIRIPLVFHNFGPGMPAKVRLLIVAPNGEFEATHIDELKLIHDDDPEREMRTTWTEKFTPSPVYVWNPKSGQAERDKSGICEGNTDLAIQHFGTYRIAIKGRFIKTNMEELAFVETASITVVGRSVFGIFLYNYVSLIKSSYAT